MGRRVSVRRAVGRGPDGRLRLGDVVGDLAGLDAQTAVVETRTGLVEVPVGLVTAARLAPPSTADELALEAIAARGLRPAESERLDGWLLRADDGFTRRANSALPLRQSKLPLSELLERAHDWYAARNLPLRVQVPVGARRLLDAELGERGWPAGARTTVYAARLDHVRASVAEAPPVTLADRPDDDWLALYRGGSGRDRAARALLTRHPRAVFASVRVDGKTAAVGRGSVDDGWLGVMAVEVEPAHRRRGLATAVLAVLRDWGRGAGATHSYLAAEQENAAATSLYEGLGYWAHHEYHYRNRP